MKQFCQQHWRTAAACLFGLLLVGGVYRDLRSFHFMSDAWGELRYNRQHNPLRFLVKDTYNSYGGRHYRPTWRMSGWIQHKLSGDKICDPKVYYTFQGMWHLLCCINVFLLVRLLGAGSLAALLALLLFGLHPAVVEAVAWSAAESFLLAGFFGTLAAVLAICHLKRPHAALLAGTLVSCWLAMTSNETALGIPLLIALLAWQQEAAVEGSWSDQVTTFVRARWKLLAGLAGLLVLYFAIRLILFGAISNWYPGPSTEGVLRRHEIADYFKTIPALTLWQFWPAWLDQRVSIFDPLVYIGMGVVVVMVVCWFAVVRRETWAVFATGLFLCYTAQFPSHRIHVVGDEPNQMGFFGSRILYLSIICFALALAPALQRLFDAGLPARRLTVILTMILLVQFAVSTAANLRVYEQSSDFLRRFCETLPTVVPDEVPEAGIAFVGVPHVNRFRPVPGMITNDASMFWVGTQDMVDLVLRDRARITAESYFGEDEPPPGAIRITMGQDGSAQRLP